MPDPAGAARSTRFAISTCSVDGIGPSFFPLWPLPKVRLLINDVGIVDFDGRGNFTRNDAGNNGGVPKSNGAFNNNQFGTYAANPAVNPAVNPDCTGTMVINYGTRAAPAGVTLTVQIAISGDGTVVMGEMSSGTVPIGAEPPVVDDGKCGNPSPEAVQIGFEGKKVLVYGFR